MLFITSYFIYYIFKEMFKFFFKFIIYVWFQKALRLTAFILRKYLDIKVLIFWEGHKNFQNSPNIFEAKKNGKFFVAFSEYLNFIWNNVALTISQFIHKIDLFISTLLPTFTKSRQTNPLSLF